MNKINLPAVYDSLSPSQRREIREQYITIQKGKCFYCGESLLVPAPTRIRGKWINSDIFPKGFLTHPIHLQHDHDTGLTEGAVHCHCNAVMWQYEGR